MYSQSCSYFPNKKQSPFTDSLGLTKNLGLLRNFTNSSSFSKFDDSTNHSSENLTSSTKNYDHQNFKSRTSNIMDFVYSFGDSSRLKLRNSISNLANQRERNKHCKEMVSPYESINTMSFSSSHLIGGFVGSKSQLGRRPSHGFGFKMWDMIRELVDLVGNAPPDISMKENILKPSLNCKTSSSMLNDNGHLNPHMNLSNNDLCLVEWPISKTRDSGKSLKQSYAEVAKTKLPVSEECMTIKVTKEFCNKINNSSSKKSSSSEFMMEPPAHRSVSPNRGRITSECSVDSEDSFIVFECCEGDDTSVSDDSDCSSDDESIMSFHLNEESSPSHRDCVPSETFSFNDESCGPPVKKVRFAEGKNLAKVHPMVTWNYAYRTARRGPWEMMARDSERFRCRISKTEAILQPVLDPVHREAVFQQRFADNVS